METLKPMASSARPPCPPAFRRCGQLHRCAFRGRRTVSSSPAHGDQLPSAPSNLRGQRRRCHDGAIDRDRNAGCARSAGGLLPSGWSSMTAKRPMIGSRATITSTAFCAFQQAGWFNDGTLSKIAPCLPMCADTSTSTSTRSRRGRRRCPSRQGWLAGILSTKQALALMMTTSQFAKERAASSSWTPSTRPWPPTSTRCLTVTTTPGAGHRQDQRQPSPDPGDLSSRWPKLHQPSALNSTTAGTFELPCLAGYLPQL